MVKTGAKLEEENYGKGFNSIEILIESSNDSVDLVGSFKNVIIKTKANVNIGENTEIEHLETSATAEGSKIRVSKNAVIQVIVLNGATSVEGLGTIISVYINTEGSTIEQQVREYQLAETVKLVIIAGRSVTQNITTRPPSTRTPRNDNDDSTPSKPQPQPDPQLEAQGMFMVEDRLYSKFNLAGDYSLSSWTINNTVTQAVYNTEYQSTQGNVGVFRIKEGSIAAANYNAVDSNNGIQLPIVMLSTTRSTVTDAVYGYVHYGGLNNISFNINGDYTVTDLSDQLPTNARPLSNGYIITLSYNNHLNIEARWDGTTQRWQYLQVTEIGRPDAPTGLSAEALSNTEIGLSWNEVADADYYHVYYSSTENGVYTPIMNSSGQKKQIQPQSEFGYIDNSNLPNTTRYYKVKAVINTIESDYSNLASATTYYNYHIKLDFNVTATVEHPSEPVIYVTDKDDKKLYAVNYETEEITYVSFDLPPESLTYAYGELYVSLLKGEHSSYWWEEDQEGAIAIVDAGTLDILEILDIDIDPYDIAVDRNGYIYVASGSGQWTYMKSYSRATLNEVAVTGIRQRSHIHMHPMMDRLYTITTESSPRDITAYGVSNGQFTEPSYPGGYDSPYHGDYPMNTNMRISPDGKYIFNGAGTVFYTEESRYEDMRYVYRLNSTFSDIAFQLSNNRVYTIQDNRIRVYSYDNLEQVGFYNLDGNGKVLYNSIDKLMAISVLNGKNVIELVEKDSMEIVAPVDTVGVKLDGTIVDVVYDESTNKAYAIDEAFRNLFTIDLNNEVIENTLKLPYRPSGLTISEDGTKVYIVNDDENYLVTEITLNDYQISRHLDYVSTPDSGDSSHRHIYNRAGNLYVVMGDWAPTLLLFDSATFEQINYGEVIENVGDIAFSEDNTKFYYWHQFGWSAGWAGSNVYTYSIGGSTFTKIDESQLGYPNMDRDPLDTPVLLLEDKDLLICKNKVFNLNDLTDVVYTLPESIYLVGPSGETLVGKSGIYDIDTYEKIENLPLASANKMFYSKDGILYYLQNNTLYSLE